MTAPYPVHFLMKLIHPDHRQRATEKFEDSITKKQDFEAEYRLLLPENKVCWIHNRARTIYDHTGKLFTHQESFLILPKGRWQQLNLRNNVKN